VRAFLCWTIPIAAVVALVAAAPHERLASVAPGDGLAALLTDDRRDEIDGALERITSGHTPAGVSDDTWEDIHRFYAAGDGPAWVNYASTSKASDALRVLREARAHGLNPADYGEPELTAALEALDAPAADDAQIDRFAAYDVRLTGALIALGRDVAVGRERPEAADPRWKKRRAVPDVASALRNPSEGLGGWLEAVQPPHPGYAALRHALRDLEESRTRGGWPQVPALPKKMKAGDSDSAVIVLRQRLAATGELSESAAASASPVLDDEVTAAVRAFQVRHGLAATGVPDAGTVAALNVPVEQRIRQVALNLERWRWMPDDLGADHLLVNIPAFLLFAREDGQTVFAMRVVVGKRTLQTPVFSSEMDRVVFSPFWNIPVSIATGETAPAAAEDPEYLRKRGIEILRRSRSGTDRVDPAEVDWRDSAQVRQLAFRQRPGPQNALGNVKFLFPNPFDIYLHDTPSDSLFARANRALSHGCVRVEEPEKLARHVLRAHPEWTGERIVAAMRSGAERGVKLDTELPVHIAYFTAWVNDEGKVAFYPDVYGHDRR
jgi:murein L,D-transpeptidase YcbB/YkuD